VAVRRRWRHDRRGRGGSRIELVPQRYTLAIRFGWRIVDEYVRHKDTPAGTWAAIASSLSEKLHVPITRYLVRRCVHRYLRHGDPTVHGTGGNGLNRRANEAERLWIKDQMRENPDMFFREVSAEFNMQFGWRISTKMISQALHFHGTAPGDEALSLKVLERVAIQRNEEERALCREVLAGLPSECFLIMDESSIDKRTLRRRRGWGRVNRPSQLYHHRAIIIMIGALSTTMTLLLVVCRLS
jgi:hypothetical protein